METAAGSAETLKLLLDEMLDPEIAVQLRRRGYDVVAVAEREDLRGLLDPEVFEVARREGRCLAMDSSASPIR